MKPQLEVVTAQDVQSSLYYMHLDRPEDCELLAFFQDSGHLADDESVREKAADLPATGGVQRKPLPTSLVYGLGDRVKPPPEVSSYPRVYSRDSTGILNAERQPFSQIAEHRHSDVSPPLPDRKLFGARPMSQRFLYTDNHPLGHVAEMPSVDLRKRSEQPAKEPPTLPPRPISRGKENVPITPPRPFGKRFQTVGNDGNSRFLHRKPVAPCALHGFNTQMEDGANAESTQGASLSLIRRYDNEQWTVGKIFSKGKNSTPGGFGGSSAETSIHIMTHGYSRFVDHINPTAEQAVLDTDKSNGSCNAHRPVDATEEQLCFRRYLQVPGYSVVRENQRYRPESTNFTTTCPGTKRPSFDLRSHSHQSSDSTESHRSMSELKSGHKKTYILKSPWGGICEFTTGRSFKCKHSYASSKSIFKPGMLSAQVSELRFNLPSPKTVGSTASRSMVSGPSRKATRSSLFAHQHGRRSSSSFEAKNTQGSKHLAPNVELEKSLDLSLGQEHAGGGFGGKQAKLGKLIVEKEGLQMLDLIVAANMALWWQVYERVSLW